MVGSSEKLETSSKLNFIIFQIFFYYHIYITFGNYQLKIFPLHADIVVSNPPFSLFREYVAQLIEYDKKFIIIGNKNAITYKEIFKLIQNNQLWVGNTPMSSDLLFDVPDEYAEFLLARKKEGRWISEDDIENYMANMKKNKQCEKFQRVQ